MKDEIVPPFQMLRLFTKAEKTKLKEKVIFILISSKEFFF